MPIARGSRLGSYEIVALVGAGAMGEVYRARDTRLGREVAIKILPQALTADADRLARFEREARVLAALNHPNIATIHGVEEGDGARALVMELVDGETVAELIARRRRGGRTLPVSDALRVGRQIAAAIEAAHDKGIVHRDLKPANAKVNSAGVVKVLDFGLAKVREPPGAGEPKLTMAADATREGTMLGTVAYMSPEQARGFGVDHSTDVWAFGCVLYELLCGRPAFDRQTVSDTIAAVLEHEPDWTLLPAAVPGTIRRLLQRCLEKDPRQRLKDMAAVRIVVEDALADVDAAAAPDRGTAGPPRVRFAWVVAASMIVALAIGALSAYRWGRPATPEDPIRLSVTAPGPITPQLSGAISPDGRYLAFVATGPSGRSMLWVRALDSLEPLELPGTERAAHPFWSPDSRSIGFIADAKIRRIDVAGGLVQTLADASTTWRAGGAWSPDGVIVFSPQPNQLAAVPAGGGATVPLLTADSARGQTLLLWPDFLPDGRHFLYYAESTQPEYQGVFVGSLDSPETTRLLESDVRAKYAAPGYLLFLRDETLMAQPFDAGRLTLHGEPRAVADGLWFARSAHHASFSVSRTGTLAYVSAALWDRQLVWFDRGGRRIGNLGPIFRDANGSPQLSPDARRVAIGRGERAFGDIWVLDVGLEALSRATFGSTVRFSPAWAADSRRLAIQAGPKVSVRNLDDGSEEALFEMDSARLQDWSGDGRFMVLWRDADLWVVDLQNDRAPSRYLETPVNEDQAQISPNGRWIVYTSNETGSDEVYVQSFPAAGRKRQISVDGGAMPRWRRDGAELVYVAADQTMTAVPILDADTLELGPPEPLFRTPLLVQGSESSGLPTAYDITADGQRFLLALLPENPAPPMIVVLDWAAALSP